MQHVAHRASDTIAQLNRENSKLREALKPFADYSRIQSTQGRNMPKSGVIWATETAAGRAEITVEDLRAAERALED